MTVFKRSLGKSETTNQEGLAPLPIRPPDIKRDNFNASEAESRADPKCQRPVRSRQACEPASAPMKAAGGLRPTAGTCVAAAGSDTRPPASRASAEEALAHGH